MKLFLRPQYVHRKGVDYRSEIMYYAVLNNVRKLQERTALQADGFTIGE